MKTPKKKAAKATKAIKVNPLPDQSNSAILNPISSLPGDGIIFEGKKLGPAAFTIGAVIAVSVLAPSQTVAGVCGMTIGFCVCSFCSFCAT
jgi:hypothetical protein